MRIPLDHYRILGLPLEATSDQIRQAFEDRLQQLPKQQYSNAAIAARKKLLQEAHAVLSTPKRRQDYDRVVFSEIQEPGKPLFSDFEATEASKVAEASELGEPSEEEPPGLNIDPDLLAGALLLLLEVGEFNAVLTLGRQYLDRPINLEKLPNESGPSDDDVTLAVAFAYLEIGREEWQNGDCETAGQSLQSGLDLLRDEGKFLDIQAEISGDLNKLRPYRVLELLALEEEDPHRTQGFHLLQTMLDDRGGMDGSGNDHSGLDINDFLLFMQQIRDYLTVEEQFMLFKAESLRPSSVATYLSVYTHVARGVSQGKPSLISQAKSLLGSLSARQDLTIEQGMCSLLLGQPEAAVDCVKKSTDEEALSFIQDCSEGAPDLIPGLYLYTEQWLQQEVYPYYRDLSDKTVSLEAYFNDESIQAMLADLEPELPDTSVWDSDALDAQWDNWANEASQNAVSDSVATPTSLPQSSTQELTSSSSVNRQSNPLSSLFSWSQEPTLELQPEAGAVVQSSRPKLKKPPKSQPSKSPNKKSIKTLSKGSSTQVEGSRPIRPSLPQSQAQRKGWLPWLLALLLGIGVVWGMLALGSLLSPKDKTPSENEPESTDPAASPQANSSPTPPPSVSTPSSDSSPSGLPVSADQLDQQSAQQIIQSWQTLKAQALGKEHQIGGLEKILTGAALSEWQYSARTYEDEGIYYTYDLKSLTIESVKPSGADTAVVRAKIEEQRSQFISGAAEPSESGTDSYQVDYDLKKVDQEWRISRMSPL